MLALRAAQLASLRRRLHQTPATRTEQNHRFASLHLSPPQGIRPRGPPPNGGRTLAPSSVSGFPPLLTITLANRPRDAMAPKCRPPPHGWHPDVPFASPHSSEHSAAAGRAPLHAAAIAEMLFLKEEPTAPAPYAPRQDKTMTAPLLQVEIFLLTGRILAGAWPGDAGGPSPSAAEQSARSH